jgi:hypothetical protein
MIEGHTPISVKRFLGIYSMGDDDNVPENHLIDALNLRLEGDTLQTREGSVLAFTKAGILRTRIYRKYGEATRFLVLTTGGNLFDSADLVNPILTIASMTDFSVAPIFNRVYITPQDRITGLAGEKVYVYNGTGAARAAAGTPPTGFTLGVADSALSGNLELGLRLFAVAFETASGFITAPGPALFTEHTAVGGFKVDISAIPLGPAGTIARHIICTKVITDYDGNQNAQEYYFAYGGEITNNSATTITLDFFDAQLVESADYLFGQLTEIPASLGLVVYQGSLVAWGENSYPYIVRVSTQGEPESFDGEVGFLTVEPTDSSGVKSVVEYRNQLVMLKSNRTSATQRVPNSPPVFWEVISVDPSVGGEIGSIGKILDSPGAIQDYFLVATRSGLLFFNGSYSGNLAAKIQSLWDTISFQYLSTVQIVIDSDLKRIYCAVPVSATSPNQLFVCDYSGGISAESVAWTRWTFPIVPTSILLDFDYTTKKAVFYYASTNAYKLSGSATDDATVAIDSWLKTTKFSITKNESEDTFTGLRLRILGSGNLAVTISGEDDSNPLALTARALATAPGKPLFYPLNYVSERASATIRVNSFGEWFKLKSFRIYGTPLWNERPQ